MITDDHYKELDSLLKACVEHEYLLSEWEQGYVTEWCDKLDTYGTDCRVSDKQQQVFDRLSEKLTKHGAL